eukprot:CAMPEP_0202352668 /NCGR_PEP_ID=MMETSP1126-20121109/8762_1 /ASSEMBLY_ACC=CAM_ASM_000457 /TAXON_ID=3047 /ORGANISM="Dunaliella tertiolecta, Strain CCMP1320" /LENGTH=799 /DNA_ID=CAMNT_0048944913 /DNA_START=62 /DNA_END=2461 /DNA_ORIENTATION=+
MAASRNADDDLYRGYDDSPLNASGGGIFQPVGMEGEMLPGTAMVGRPPGSAMKTYVAPGTAQRLGTASGLQDGARPMTSHRGAGFSSAPNKKWDPLSQHAGKSGGGLAGKTLDRKGEISAEETAKEIEEKVHQLLEESAVAACSGDQTTGLEKAIEARKKERSLCKYRDVNNIGELNNMDLTYAVDFNLAHMNHANKNYKEAIEQFTDLVRNKNYPQSGGLRVNLGNIYFEQQKFSLAIKNYRMALDQVPQTGKEVQFKIMRNIGLAFVHMGQYQDAHQTFTTVMNSVPDHQTGYNLVVCSFALGDREGMKQAFLRLLEVPPYEMEDDEDVDLLGLMGGEDDDMQNVVQNDGLREELRKRQNYITRCIVNSAQLISEKIEKAGYAAGYDWCVEQLRAAGYMRLANEVELAKASKFLMGNKEFESAIAVFKEFEKKESRVRARAATNLAFLHMLEAHTDVADKYAELALKSDRYNARAFVNKGCVLAEKGDYEGAKSLFLEALAIEPYCVEANFNVGLVNLRMDDPESALISFKKLNKMLPENTEMLFQLAQCYDIMGDFHHAVEHLKMLNSLLPNDPGVLARLGAIHARVDDEAGALHFYQEAHRVYPVSMDVISWLGAFHVRNEVYEKAMPYFDLASKIQPQEVKWGLMVASCLRRVGAYPQALARYKAIDAEHPNNVECLKYLVHLCTELGRRDDAQAYMERLRKAEKAQAAEATVVANTMAARQQQSEFAANGQSGSGGMMNGAGAAGPAFIEDSYQMSAGLNVPVSQGKKVVAKVDGHNDDWGDEELGDDLLPMG